MVKKQVLKNGKKALTILSLLIAVVVLFGLILSIPFLNKIYPNIYIAGIYLGDKNKEDAIKELQQKYKLPKKLILSVNGKKNEILVSEIVTNVNYQDSINRAYNFANSGNILQDFYTKVKLIFKPVNITPILVMNEEKLLETLLIISSSTGTKSIEPSAKKVDGKIVVDPGKDGVEINIEKARTDIGFILVSNSGNEVQIESKQVKAALNSEEVASYKLRAEKLLGKNITLTLDDTEFVLNDSLLISLITSKSFSDLNIKNEILNISKKLNRNPQDSVFVVENNVVVQFAPSKDGIVVDEKVLEQNVKSSLEKLLSSSETEQKVQISVLKTSPKIKNEDVNNLGINSLLGAGHSNFKGSIPNRIHNVNLAQSKFKGILVPPNEIVSFNQVLGDVSAYTGYKTAYVIMDGKTVLGDGGGVCQVSTTLFRAVLNAGLPVTERRAHAYRVGYYEQGFGPGLDATVYSPTTDFKFKNDTPAYLLIQPIIDLNSLALTFEIYGTDDGRVATVSKPVITSSSSPAEDLYVDDPTLPLGTVKQIEHRAYGARVVFDYKVTRNGESLIDQKFVSNYRPWRAVYLKGTAQ